MQPVRNNEIIHGHNGATTSSEIIIKRKIKKKITKQKIYKKKPHNKQVQHTPRIENR